MADVSAIRQTIRSIVKQARSGKIDKVDAVRSVTHRQIIALLSSYFDETETRTARRAASGHSLSYGAATGSIAYEPTYMERCVDGCILICRELQSEHLVHSHKIKGIVTSASGSSSHAAVIARQRGIPCVSGVSVYYDQASRTIAVGDAFHKEGDIVSLDGNSGNVYVGLLTPIVPTLNEQYDLLQVLEWADSIRRLGVRANADNAREAEASIAYGAQGIGVCRTEHLFTNERSFRFLQSVLIAQSGSDAEMHALRHLYDFHYTSMVDLFEVMRGLPVTVRLLDIPLHEVFPNDAALYEVGARSVYREQNPMLGLRGVRLGLTRPAIYEMQVRVILRASQFLASKGIASYPEIMVPMVASTKEVTMAKDLVSRVANELSSSRMTADYRFGVMIELPRVALVAQQIAEHVSFFSFGTNDLTQTVWGLSRDDAEQSFLLDYIDSGVISTNPFVTLDIDGVGSIMQEVVSNGRQRNPSLKISICGEQGSDPDSISFCDAIGLDYVSCVPSQVPLARLAAAQSVLQQPG